MVAIVNDSSNHVESITLKYFEAGHTFMSADSFHHQVEKEATTKGNLYDLEDFLQCVRNSGTCVLMNEGDFLQWRNEMLESKTSKTLRPLLNNMVVAHFKRGSTNMHYKSALSMTEYKGVQAEQKKGIISNLLPLMPENCKAFWLNMKISELLTVPHTC